MAFTAPVHHWNGGPGVSPVFKNKTPQGSVAGTPAPSTWSQLSQIPAATQAQTPTAWNGTVGAANIQQMQQAQQMQQMPYAQGQVLANMSPFAENYGMNPTGVPYTQVPQVQGPTDYAPLSPYTPPMQHWNGTPGSTTQAPAQGATGVTPSTAAPTGVTPYEASPSGSVGAQSITQAPSAYSTMASSASQSASQAAASQATPSYSASNLLPTEQAVLSGAPSPYSTFGQIPYIDPTMMTAAMTNPGTLPQMEAAQGYATGANAATFNPLGIPQMGAAQVQANNTPYYMQQYEQMVQQAMAPENLQQQQQLQGDMASRGIQDSGAASYLMGNLQSQQGAALASALSPFAQQGFGYQQQDLAQNAANLQSSLGQTYQGRLGMLGQDVGNLQQTGLFNAQAQNSMASQNAAQQQAANAENYQGTMGTIGQNQQALQAANAMNAQATNAASNQNAGAYYNVAQNQQALFNDYLNQLYGSGQGLSNSLLGNYFSSYGMNPAVSSAMQQGAAAQTNAYGNAYNLAVNQNQQNANAFGSMLGMALMNGGG